MILEAEPFNDGTAAAHFVVALLEVESGLTFGKVTAAFVRMMLGGLFCGDLVGISALVCWVGQKTNSPGSPRSTATAIPP